MDIGKEYDCPQNNPSVKKWTFYIWPHFSLFSLFRWKPCWNWGWVIGLRSCGNAKWIYVAKLLIICIHLSVKKIVPPKVVRCGLYIYFHYLNSSSLSHGRIGVSPGISRKTKDGDLNYGKGQPEGYTVMPLNVYEGLIQDNNKGLIESSVYILYSPLLSQIPDFHPSFCIGLLFECVHGLCFLCVAIMNLTLRQSWSLYWLIQNSVFKKLPCSVFLTWHNNNSYLVSEECLRCFAWAALLRGM